MIENKKSLILLVLKTLEEYSDEEHFLTQQDIADKIYECYGVEFERKSIGSSLSILDELGYDINKGPRGGFALLSRNLDQSEADFIIDAIFSSKSISGKDARQIAKDVYSCFSKYQRKDYSYIYKTSEINRTDNHEVLFNVSLIHEAIKQSKRVGFNYLTYDSSGNKVTKNGNYEYIVSPYYLINNFGRYYLLCNYREKYRPLQIFRLDYMVNIQIKEDWPLKELKSLKELPKDFSITKYINDHIYMLDGDSIDAVIEFDEINGLSIAKDWFGDKAKIKVKNNKPTVEITCNETALYYWVMQYSDCMKVISPSSFAIKIKEGLEKALKRYE